MRVIYPALVALGFALGFAFIHQFDPAKCPTLKHDDAYRLYLGQLSCSFQKQCLVYIDKTQIQCGDPNE